MKIYLSVILVLIFASVCFGQTIIPNQAIVYLYTRDAPLFIGKLRAQVYFDGMPLVQIPQNQYCIALIEAGTHSFHFGKDKKKNGIEKNFEAGQTYYLRIGWKKGITIKPDGLKPVTPEAATADLKQLKPIDEKEIMAKDLVVTKLPE